ncbi:MULTISPECIES: DUF881 domain-containing protein [Oerskovia]|uniref:DUF881 domain-containing protein n=1 Tax=Oerskovia merdavium TaxID=2762227 RepID=A0ABR8TXL3_9CELL|nr:DUF881 domain-containing protein [Oerskovia merdavium]MBD7980203.1 DUF881 domain-containing protein [Oerskovia merdavium]
MDRRHGATHDTGGAGAEDAPSSTAGEPAVTAATRPLTRARRIRSSVTVLLVLGLSGLMFSASARLAQGQEGRHPENLTDLVQSEERRVEDMTEKVVGLEVEVSRLAAGTGQTETESPELVERTGIVSGAVAVTGPGLSVTLDDAPLTQDHSKARVDDLVVHQQDLQEVINALWAGGAEAMTLQGQRVTPTTAFRCVGNVLNLHGRVFSPPYTVSAVGDPVQLQKALDRSDAIDIYKQYVDEYGLGWKVDKSDSLLMPVFEGAPDLKYARVAGSADEGA